MFKKSLGILLILSMVPVLSNCSQGQLNGVAATGTTSTPASVNPSFTPVKKSITLNLNIQNLALQDIIEIQVDGKKLDSKDFQLSSTKIILPELTEGKHVIRFSHKTLGEVDIPIEVKNGAINNFQFNIQLSSSSANAGKIDSWEVGTDADLDGLIDEGAFFSKDFKSYVVVREGSGTLNYLPKEDFSSDFRQNIQPPRPAGFQFPEIKENELRGGMMPPQGSTVIQGDQLEYPFPGNIGIPLADNADKLKGFRAVAITNENTIFPISTYIIKNNLLVLDNKTFGNQKLFNLYLLDDTGKGILLKIEALKPLLTPSTPSTPVMPSANPGQPVNNPPAINKPGTPPQGNMPSGMPNRPFMPGSPPDRLPPNLPAQGNQTGQMPADITPMRPSDETSTLNLINTSDLKFTVLDNVKLTEADLKNLTVYEEVFIVPDRSQAVTRKILLPVADSDNQEQSGYIRITPEGEMVDFIPSKDFTRDTDTVILDAKN